MSRYYSVLVITVVVINALHCMFVFNSLVTHQPLPLSMDLFPHHPFPQGSLPLALPFSIILARHNDYVYMELNCPIQVDIPIKSTGYPLCGICGWVIEDLVKGLNWSHQCWCP